MAERIVVGMSGGVDSSVAALLLKREGYDVVGLFMKNWEDDDNDEYCSTREDLIDAAAAADVIGIELEAVNFAAEYKDRVFAEFLREYQAGPHAEPGRAVQRRDQVQGLPRPRHRRWARRASRPATMRGFSRKTIFLNFIAALDPSKDQSYFLHRLNQAQLSRVFFRWETEEDRGAPHRRRGAACRTTPRRIRPASASSASGRSASSSTATCRASPAPIVTPEGMRIGTHIGLAFYTIGQSKGIGIGGIAGGRRATPGTWRRRTRPPIR